VGNKGIHFAQESRRRLFQPQCEPGNAPAGDRELIGEAIDEPMRKTASIHSEKGKGCAVAPDSPVVQALAALIAAIAHSPWLIAYVAGVVSGGQFAGRSSTHDMLGARL
jgi:hypothetical protein